MQKHTFVVFSEPVVGKEDEYNEWYNGVHLKDVLKVPGFKSARRLKLDGSRGSKIATYLALYEIESENPNEVLENLKQRTNTPLMMLSESLDLKSVSTFLYREIIALA